MKTILPSPSPAEKTAAVGIHPLMKAEAVRQRFQQRLAELLAHYDSEIAQALAGLQDDEYLRAEQEGYRWRLTRDFRAYFEPWES